MLTASRSFALFPILVAASLAVAPTSASAKQFAFDEKVNQQMARQLNVPVYFTVPASAMAPLAGDISTSDRLIEFRHPETANSDSKVGLRLIVAKRSGLAKRLAQSGLVQTGDILLTFRSEWAGAGAYPNVQMGISHAGVAYVKNGVAHNIDNPMDEEYIGSGKVTELNSKHYRSIKLVHIIRPRNLTEAQRANIADWASRLNAAAKRVYPSQVSFNSNYQNPKFKPRRPLSFVKHLGQVALGHNPPGKLDLFCSEFAWSLLALRDCDPDKTGDAFKGGGVPSCVRPPMQPMRATGSYVTRKGRSAYTGLADGPYLVIDALHLPRAEQEKMLQSIFVENPKGLAKMSSGHRTVAKEMQPKFARLAAYYQSAASGSWLGLKAKVMGAAIGQTIPENYSPTSFLINTLLPPDSPNRTMDYVATIVFE
jgi:hypothetical protein